MLFSTIYSIDVSSKDSVEERYPPGVEPGKEYDHEVWECTESGETQYAYLEGAWKDGQHRKFSALLTREEFEAFLRGAGLCASWTETGGSIGAPGFDIYHAPAIAFDSDYNDAIIGAYVTPIPTVHTREQFMEREGLGLGEDAWNRVRKVVIETYEHGG